MAVGRLDTGEITGVPGATDDRDERLPCPRSDVVRRSKTEGRQAAATASTARRGIAETAIGRLPDTRRPLAGTRCLRRNPLGKSAKWICVEGLSWGGAGSSNALAGVVNGWSDGSCWESTPRRALDAQRNESLRTQTIKAATASGVALRAFDDVGSDRDLAKAPRGSPGKKGKQDRCKLAERGSGFAAHGGENRPRPKRGWRVEWLFQAWQEVP